MLTHKKSLNLFKTVVNIVIKVLLNCYFLSYTGSCVWILE